MPDTVGGGRGGGPGAPKRQWFGALVCGVSVVNTYRKNAVTLHADCSQFIFAPV